MAHPRSAVAITVAIAIAAPAAFAQQAPAASAPPAPMVANFDSAWASMSRTYWDTVLVNGRWRAAHDSLRAIAAGVEDETRMRELIRALMAVPAQSHFVLIPRSVVTDESQRDAADARGPANNDEPGTIGLELRMLGDTLVAWRVAPGSPAAAAGVRPGATITHFGRLSVDSMRKVLLAATPHDTAATRLLLNTAAIGRLSGRAGDTLSITVRDGRGRARARRVALVRVPLPGRATKFGNLPTMVVNTTGDSVVLGNGSRGVRQYAPVIGFSAWFPVISGELDERLFAARDARGVVIDLRGNPGGVVGMLAGVSGHFLDSAVALGTMRGRGATIHFVANPRKVDRAGRRVRTITAPLAILIDGYSGSTSEFFASGMQAIGRARVFGVSSAGQALPALMVRLPNGDVLMHAIADHEDAAGRRVEGKGVQPDEVTPLTRADLVAGRDAALEAARAWLVTQQGRKSP